MHLSENFRSRFYLPVFVVVVLLVLQRNAAGETFKNPLLVLTGSNPVTVSQGDLDSDGNPDLAYIDGSGLHILLGRGDGTFQSSQDISLPQGMGGTITVADVNRDSKMDLLFGGVNPKAQIGALLGNGDGTFGSLIVSTLPVSLNLYAVIGARFGVTDLNGDGAADIVASDTQNDLVYVLLGNNTGSFVLKTSIPNFSGPADVLIGDFNGDGHEDFLVRGGPAANATIYLGNGNATFQAGVEYGGVSDAFTSVVLADMDGDGLPDMVISNQANAIEILHANSDGTFAVTSSGGPTLSSYSLILAVADFNSDGILDIAVLNGNGLSILLGTGSLHYAAPVPYGLGTSASSSALADFNHDGHADFALATTGGIALLLGKGNGTFQSFDVYDLGQPVDSIAAADFNGDHIADIGVAESAAGPGILLGKGDGTFKLQATSPAVGGTGSIALTGDFNGDGKADLYFTSVNSTGVVLFGNGNATFGNPVNLTGFQQTGFVAAAVADLNHDGRTDLVNTNYQSIDVLLGQSNKTFNLLTSSLSDLQSSIAPAIADLNKDGKPDVVVAGVITLQVHIGNGDGTFAPGRTMNTQLPGFTNLCSPRSIATADLDGDGNLDLVVPISYPYVAEIFYGNGDGTFQDPVVLPLGRGYTQVLIADLNGDHLPDLVFSDQAGIAIVHNAGNRIYSPETHYLAGVVGNIAVQDFNGDGFLDLAVASSGTTVAVLLNQPQQNLTTGTLSIQPEPSTYTKSFSMSLTLAPLKSGSGTPTGNVTFSIDGSPVGTVPLSGSVATFAYQSSSLAIGSHTISVVYNGDANFVPSYFAAQHQLIPIVYPTSVTLAANPNPVVAGQTVSFKATVTSTGQIPGGKVSIIDGTTPLGAVTLDTNSLAVFDTALLSPGKHSVKANYIGNANFAAASSSPVTVTVNTNKTNTKVTVNPTTVALGATVLLSATVASLTGTPTGAVVFYDGSLPLQNTAIDANGVAVYGATFSTSGTHLISAVYGANASFASSTSPVVNVTVTGNPSGNASGTSLSAVSNPQVARSFILTATVTSRGRNADGNVIFLDGDFRLGTVVLDETGSATYQSSSLVPGVHYISAFYPGKKTLAPSVSQVVIEKFAADTPDFSIAVSPGGVVLGSVSASAQVDVSSINGFDGDVALSCATGSPRLSCDLQSPDIRGGSGRAELTISVADLRSGSPPQNFPPFLRVAGTFAAPVICLAFLRRRNRFAGIVLSLTLLCAGLTIGCGSPSIPAPKATAGKYSVAVTGVSAQASSVVIHRFELQVQVSPN